MFLLLALQSLTGPSSLADFAGHPVKQYRWIFFECTGQNQFVLAGKYALPIQFDRRRSDKEAFGSLYALCWEVLYANSDGRIIIEGELSTTPSPLPTWDKNPGAGDAPG